MIMSNKIEIKLYVPTIDAKYDVLIPKNKKIYVVIDLLVRAINEFSGGYYKPKDLPNLYDKNSAKQIDYNLKVMESTIKNGTELILL